jgi:hypothetical protein
MAASGCCFFSGRVQVTGFRSLGKQGQSLVPEALVVVDAVPHAARLFGWPLVDLSAQVRRALLPPDRGTTNDY